MMGFRYTPEDLIRRSDFYDWYRSFPEETRQRIRQRVEGFVRENPSFRLSLLTGPGYLVMHWLMGDLYTSLACTWCERRREKTRRRSLPGSMRSSRKRAEG